MTAPRITWRDAQRMPDDGNRYEAINGILHVTAAPKWRHQVVSKRLLMRLSELLEDPGHGEVVAAPGVEFPATGEGVQPDILFVSNERRHIVEEAGLVGAPDLVVEVLSPSTAERDRGANGGSTSARACASTGSWTLPRIRSTCTASAREPGRDRRCTSGPSVSAAGSPSASATRRSA